MQNIPTVSQRKICLLGDFAVGKTSLIRRFVEGCFDDQYLSSIGVKISRRIAILPDEKKVNLIIWDVAGGEEFNGKQASYLQGSSAALLVCDLTRKTSLFSLRKYAFRLREIEPESKFMLVANKCDLDDQFELTQDDLAILADELQAAWFMTSAKTGKHVEEAFDKLAKLIVGGAL